MLMLEAGGEKGERPGPTILRRQVPGLMLALGEIGIHGDR